MQDESPTRPAAKPEDEAETEEPIKLKNLKPGSTEEPAAAHPCPPYPAPPHPLPKNCLPVANFLVKLDIDGNLDFVSCKAGQLFTLLSEDLRYVKGEPYWHVRRETTVGWLPKSAVAHGSMKLLSDSTANTSLDLKKM